MRLELSKRSDLAIRALRILHARGARVKRTELADLLSTTPDYLARVMTPLVAMGWVVSQTGPTGGYRIGPDAVSATVYDLIEAVEGVPVEGVCVLRDGSCNPLQPCALHEAWSRARKALLDELRGSTILD